MNFSFLKNHTGATFIELLLYISVFLVLTPILLSVSINSISMQQQNNVEKQVNADSQFIMKRVYDLISDAKKINASDSRLGDNHGKLSLVMQDDSDVIIELDEDTSKIEITEGGVTSALSSDTAEVENMFFDRITDRLNDPDIILGISVRMKISGVEKYDVMQNYVVTANLERGDFDGDGCPDYLDKFPKTPECCGDADIDGRCDEQDNCVFAYNPFQEDTDGDLIGDECDSSTFFEGGDDEGGNGGGGFGAFNCSGDSQLLAIIRQQPPLSSVDLKQIMLSSSPLPPTVLNELITKYPILTKTHFTQVFIANTKLPAGVLTNVMSMPSLPVLNKVIIYAADIIATYVPWLGIDRRNYVNYQVILSSDAPQGQTWVNKIKFYNADYPLSVSTDKKTDVFMITVLNPAEEITVTTETATKTDVNTISFTQKYIEDDLGFSVELYNKVDNIYAIGISMANNKENLKSVMFDFGAGSTVTNPTAGAYKTNRYTCYCEGGCADDCGDGGTGIITSNVYTDRCYTWNFLFPEWCSNWYTFLDDNSNNPAYIGGTHAGDNSVYWEKSFKTILTHTQLLNLKSITVGGQVAYQSLGQFFCDTLHSSCLMNGNLTGAQNVEMYNWQTGQWEVIGAANVVGTTSDQQTFEVKYAVNDVLKYVGGSGGINIKARINFHWNGTPPQGQTSAPCFMLIDYFTLHLLW
jgi:hypothetical protein